MTRCPLCKSGRHRFHVNHLLDGREKHFTPQAVGMEVWECQQCGAFFYVPTPTREELIAYHGQDYFVAPSPEEATGYLNYLDENHLRSKLDWGLYVATWLYQADPDKREPTKKALDVGCATGIMIQGMGQFKLCQMECTGVDVSEWATAQGKDLLCGRLPEVDLEGPFHYVSFWDSLIHDPDPIEVLKVTRDLLRPGGVAIFHTPDATDAPADWCYWSPHQHSCALPRKTFLAALQEVGLTPFRERHSTQPDEIIVMARREL